MFRQRILRAKVHHAAMNSVTHHISPFDSTARKLRAKVLALSFSRNFSGEVSQWGSRRLQLVNSQGGFCRRGSDQR